MVHISQKQGFVSCIWYEMAYTCISLGIWWILCDFFSFKDSLLGVLMLLFYPLSSLIHFPIDHTDLRERALVYVRMGNRATCIY